MPNYTPSPEKIGMQFGSLSLGGDDLDRCQFGSLSLGGDDLDRCARRDSFLEYAYLRSP